MTAGARFLVALAMLPGIGAAVLFAARRRLPGVLALLGASTAAGIATVTGEMLLLSALHVRWGLPLLLAPPAGAAAFRAFRRPRRLVEGPAFRVRAPLILAALSLLLVAYAAATARATSPDLILFWGAKGERFARAKTIDIPFLRRPELYLMHPDYPPGFPFLLAFGTLPAGRFPWGASLLLMPGLLAATAALFFAGAERRLGGDAEVASWLTLLFTATLGLTSLVAETAGNADSELILFETAALLALTSIRARTLAEWSAGIALAAALLTKIEGLFFAAIVVAGVLLLDRRSPVERVKSALRVALAPLAAFLGWYALCRSNGLLDMYRGGRFGAFTLRNLGHIPSAMAASARYDTAYLPWIVLIAAAFAFRRFGFRGLPIWTAAGFLAVNVFVYLHGTRDPTEWIGWSAGRTLMTVLVCGFAAIGAGNPAGAGTRSGPAPAF